MYYSGLQIYVYILNFDLQKIIKLLIVKYLVSLCLKYTL